jgi:hypothetical protein
MDSMSSDCSMVPDTHDVHALASVAAEFEASVEKFLDEALISDIRETPLITLDGVLDDRREREERLDRIRGRTKELMDEELAKEKHEREVRELEEAISTSSQPVPVPKQRERRPSRRDAAEAPATTAAAAPAAAPAAEGPPPPAAAVAADGEEVAAVAASLPFKLESAGVARSREQNPYVLNMTDFVPEVQATRSARDLKAENEVLRACLKGARSDPKAFESYLRRSTQTTL